MIFSPLCFAKECQCCGHIFEVHETKHHCRACGQGFCAECLEYEKPVPERGWGTGPVKVCRDCYLRSPEKVENGAVEGEMNDTR